MNVISTCLILVGLINFAPVIGLISVAKLNQAYEITLISHDIILLMRHRALLFGILGVFILYSAFSPKFQTAAIVMGFVSMAGYVLLMSFGDDYNSQLQKIMWVDIVGVVLVVIAAVFKWKEGSL